METGRRRCRVQEKERTMPKKGNCRDSGGEVEGEGKRRQGKERGRGVYEREEEGIEKENRRE